MPVFLRQDSEGCFAQWGDHGRKYRYTCGNEEERKAAAQKAAEQGRAARAAGAE